ncbi:MAG: ABC transporter substrate-binding protein [Bacteroidota bacterium]
MQLTLGGVPEHFNLPVHLAIEDGSFASRGVDIKWLNCPGGTGQMTAALREGKADACILLTEGIIKDVIAGSPSLIVSGYVNTPLIWGIHTGSESPLTRHREIYDHQYAISRYGSGSHLMAMVDATENDRRLSTDQFTVINNLEGALTSLERQDTQVFYWEKYTTKPYVRSGQLRRIGEFITPWPCFVIAARKEFLEREPEAIIRMLRTIHDSCDRFMQSDKYIPMVADRYNLQTRNVERWYHRTEWAIHGWVSDKMLRSVVKNLRLAGIVPEDQEVPELVWTR